MRVIHIGPEIATDNSDCYSLIDEMGQDAIFVRDRPDEVDDALLKRINNNLYRLWMDKPVDCELQTISIGDAYNCDRCEFWFDIR